MRFIRPSLTIFLASLIVVASAQQGSDAEDHPFITIASTTEPEQSGLFRYLLPMFTHATSIDVYLVAVGTGKALEIGRRGECDVLVVHDKPRELQFIQNGFGSVRRDVMYDRFVVVGPEDDPAKIDGLHDARAAFRKIADAHALFVSRGDESGTHAAEKRIWEETGRRPKPNIDSWYVETGSTTEQTLATTASKRGYTLSDTAAWANFDNRGRLKIVVDGDARLKNQYAVMLVNPARHPQVKADLGTAFIEWLTSPEAQATIASYRLKGEQLFYPNYEP